MFAYAKSQPPSSRVSDVRRDSNASRRFCLPWKIQKGRESFSALALSKTPDPVEFAAAATLQTPAKLPLLLGDGKGGHVVGFWEDIHDMNPLVYHYKVERTDYPVTNTSAWGAVFDKAVPAFATAHPADDSYNTVRSFADLTTTANHKYSYRLTATNDNASTMSNVFSCNIAPDGTFSLL